MMPSVTQHEWVQRVLGVKGSLGTDADNDSVADTATSTLASAASTYVDFSIGEVEGAAKVIAPMAEQASTISQNLDPAQAVQHLGEAGYKLATDEQYRDAAVAQAEAIGNTVLGVASVAARANQIATDLMVDPVQGVQEAASAAGAGAQKLGQAYGKVSAGYQDAAAKGEGARYVGNLVGQVGAMVGLAVVGAPEAGEGAAVEELGAAAKSGSVAADGLPALAEDSGQADGALADAGAPEETASAPTEEGAPVDDATTADGAEGQAASGEAVGDDAATTAADHPDTIVDGAPVEDTTVTADGADAEAGSAKPTDDPASTQEGAPVEDDPGAKTEESPPDDATTMQDGPPADYKAVAESATKRIQTATSRDLAAMPTEVKNQLINDLTKGGKPTGDAQQALAKIYRSMNLDPAFQAQDDLRMEQVAKKLEGDAELKAARENWPSLGADERVGALRKVADAQSEVYGIKSPDIEAYMGEGRDGAGGIISGSFDASGKILVNTHPESAFNSFEDAIKMVVHENGHNYQNELVKRLGKTLLPGDEEYEQATMFAANDGNGYFQPGDVNVEDYAKQPTEEHAFRTGNELGTAITLGLIR